MFYWIDLSAPFVQSCESGVLFDIFVECFVLSFSMLTISKWADVFNEFDTFAIAFELIRRVQLRFDLAFSYHAKRYNQS